MWNLPLVFLLGVGSIFLWLFPTFINKIGQKFRAKKKLTDNTTLYTLNRSTFILFFYFPYVYLNFNTFLPFENL